MINSNGTNYKVSNNYGILAKINKFIKRIFKKDNIKYISEGNMNDSNSNENNFFKLIKFEEDPEKIMLLKIQDDFEKMGINKENAFKLTKDLTDNQKQKLESLYKEQIEDYKIDTNNCKKKIVNIRQKLAQSSN